MSLPMQWNTTIIDIMELKQLNKLEFSALVGFLSNYEIVLKHREVKTKGKAKKNYKDRNIALKAQSKSENGKGRTISEEECFPSEFDEKNFTYHVKI